MVHHDGQGREKGNPSAKSNADKRPVNERAAIAESLMVEKSSTLDTIPKEKNQGSTSQDGGIGYGTVRVRTYCQKPTIVWIGGIRATKCLTM